MAALEKMFTFLEGRPYRLILFGGRQEIFVDDVTRYRNNGQWTDFYSAFVKARELMDEYPRRRVPDHPAHRLDPGPRARGLEDMCARRGPESLRVARTLALLKERKTRST